MEFFIQDCKGFFADPKDTFRRMATYESLKIPTVLMLIAGALMGLRRLLVAGEHLKDKAMPASYDLGFRDANYVMAFLTPVIVIACWYICAFIVNEVAEKLGALKGEFPEILMASGYLSYPLIAFLLVTLPLFYIGEVQHVKPVGILNTILHIAFVFWFFYLMTQIIEVSCDVPFSIAACSLLITLFGFAILYYGVIEMVINRLILVNIFQGRYQ